MSSTVQVKLFKSIETDLGQLEADLNAWLSSANVRVVNIFGNMSPQTPIPGTQGAAAPSGRKFAASDLFMAVVYEDIG